MNNRLKFEGIYDSRTLKFLKNLGVKKFGFDFNPRSFNFIQEYVFLEQIVPLLGHTDELTLTFTRSNDPMISKVLLDLKRNGFDLKNVSLICLEWPIAPAEFEVNYYLNYVPQIDVNLANFTNFKGFFFDYSLFEGMQSDGVLRAFVSNYFTRFGKVAASADTVLRVEWNDNIFPSLIDIFDFNTLSFPINADIEVCYRNVDLKKLQKEIDVHSLNRTFNEKNDF